MAKESSPLLQSAKRSLAAKANGSKGGLATAERHSQDWLHQRALKGGETTRTLYSADYYRHINQQRKTKAGWPQGKLRTAVEKVQSELQQVALSEPAKCALEHMLAATAGTK